MLICIAVALLAVDSPGEVAAKAQAVLRRHCTRCHSGPGSEGGDADFALASSMRDQKLLGASSLDSLLYDRLAVRKNGAGDMPPASIRERPSAEEKAAVKAWLDSKAQEFATAKPGSERVAANRVALKGLLKAVRDHLRDALREDRPNLRYFTLHHLHNNPNVSDADLRLYRAALAKSVNSLSWSPSITLPQAIDKAETLFVVDLRKLVGYDGRPWSEGKQWDAILRKYPYGLKYGSHPDEDLRRLDEDLSELSACDLPWVRADWFAATATRPPLYHDLLGLPQDARDLERRLGVDIGAEFLNPDGERIAYAGFPKSGVSGQNRLVARFRGQGGFYWKSYDFLPDNGRAKLTRFPLGPADLGGDRKHPLPNQAFVHDGGEIIFELPNHLQGYLLVNGKDGRIDAGPVPVVSDPLKTSGTPEIVNGVSCMACHKHGMIEQFEDRIRGANAVFGDAEALVRKLYPKQEEMQKLVAADQQRFLASLEQCIGPYLRKGPDAQKPLRSFPEPVGEIARLHRLGYLDATAAACELDLEKGEDLRRIGDKRLKQLGVEALLQPGGLTPRLEWESGAGVSLMQEVARELRFTPSVKL